jgi:hypothetical protein
MQARTFYLDRQYILSSGLKLVSGTFGASESDVVGVGSKINCLLAMS